MKYTYSKLVKDNEKKVEKAELEVHAVKWMFFNSDFFCGYSHLNDEASQEIIDKFGEEEKILEITKYQDDYEYLLYEIYLVIKSLRNYMKIL